MEVADVLAKAEEKGNRAMFGGSLYLPTDSWDVEIFAQVLVALGRTGSVFLRNISVYLLSPIALEEYVLREVMST